MSVLETPASIEHIPPALSAERKHVIEAALAKFGEFEAKNARDALKQLEKLTAYDGRDVPFRDITTAKDAREIERAFQLVEAYAGLAEGRAVPNRRVDAVKSDSIVGGPFKKAADPVYVNPFATIISGLASVNAEHSRELTSSKNNEWEKGVHRAAIAENNATSDEINTLQLKYKGALSGLSTALKENNITPDDIIRYNAELKERVIGQTLGAFAQKNEAGGDSAAETARKAVRLFDKVRISGTTTPNYAETESGIAAFEKIGQGKSVSANDSLEFARRISYAADVMQEVIAAAPASEKKSLTDARALFIEAMLPVKETFERHAISPEDLQIYNGALIKQEHARQQAFAAQATDEKIKLFAGDEANTGRYQDMAQAISSLIAVKDKLPDTFDGRTSSPKASIDANMDYLNGVRAHYQNKAAALQALAKGDALTEKQYQSISEYPVVGTQPPAAGEENAGQRNHPAFSFSYAQSDSRANPNAEENLLRDVSDFLGRFRVGITSAKPEVLMAQADIRKAHNANFPNPYLPGDAGIKTPDLERKYDIAPDKIRRLAADGKLRIAAEAELAVQPGHSDQQPANWQEVLQMQRLMRNTQSPASRST